MKLRSLFDHMHNDWIIAFIKLEKGFPLGELKQGERGIFGSEVLLCYRQFFVKSDFVIGGVECTQMNGIPMDNAVGHQRHEKSLQRL